MKLRTAIESAREYCSFRYHLRNVSICQKNRTGVILSLTSIKDRLPTLHLPIIRLLRSGFRPDHVEIWLCETLKPLMTRELMALEKKGCTLNFIKDIGPATKLIYCLGKHPGSRIITIDDDVLLPADSIQVLLNKAIEYPGVVICNMARTIALSDSGSPLPYKNWTIQRHSSKHPEKNILPLGYGGVLYPAKALSELYDHIDLMKALCPTGDDLWFTAMRLLKGGLAYNTHHLEKGKVPIPGTRNHSIKSRTGAPGNNDPSIGRLFEKFTLSAKLLDLPARPSE